MELARRAAGPVALIIACVVAWVVASNLGDLAIDRGTTVSATPARSLDAPLSSVRRLPSIPTTLLRAQRIDSALAQVPELPAPLACTTIMVGDEVVYDVGTASGLVPGPAQLFATGYAALELLGPQHRFETRAMAEQLPDDNGWVRGDLHLVGGGDPVLMSYNYARGFRPVLATYTPIEDLAEAVVDAGVVLIEGAVIGNDRRYDTQRILPGWPASLIESGVTGPLSALQLDDAFAERPGANLGVAVPAVEPALHAAQRFDDLLEDRAVVVSQSALVDDRTVDLPDLVPIGSVQSAPLEDIVFQMWAVNDSSAAEMLMKELGLRYSQEGSSQAGGDAVQFAALSLGVELPVAPRDGSGLDPVSTISCSRLAAMAAALSTEHPATAAFPHHTLPGVHGGQLADLALASDVRAIGGSVGDATSLIATTADDGDRVTIASIVNRRSGDSQLDVDYHRSLVASIDGLRAAWSPVELDGSP